MSKKEQKKGNKNNQTYWYKYVVQKKVDKDREECVKLKGMDSVKLDMYYADLKSSYELGDKWLTLFLSVMSIAFLSFVFTTLYKFIAQIIVKYQEIKSKQVSTVMNTTFVLVVLSILIVAIVIGIDLYYLRRQREKRKKLILLEKILAKKEKR